MNTAERTRAVRTLIQAEHRRLEQMVRELHRLVRDRPGAMSFDSRIAQLTEELAKLRVHLADHFEQEERGGFLEEAATSIPRLATQVTTIERQHPALLAQLDQLIARVDAENDTQAGWDGLREEFRSFAQALLQHELSENRLLQAGMNDDLELDS